MDVLSWIAPNRFSRRHTLTRPLDCLAGRLNNRNSQEPGVLSAINISFRNTCNFIYSMSVRESIVSEHRSQRQKTHRCNGHDHHQQREAMQTTPSSSRPVSPLPRLDGRTPPVVATEKIVLRPETAVRACRRWLEVS